MPDRGAHLKLADHNLDALRYVAARIEDFPDWVCTIAFYRAVHLVEALLDHDGVGHSATHKSRQRVLKRNPRYREIYKHYRPLRAASEIARYMVGDGREYAEFTDYLSPEQVRSEVLDHRLEKLNRSVSRLLSKPGGPRGGSRSY